MSDDRVTFHLVPEALWLAQRESGSYQPERFVEEGFIHTTLGEELLLDVANRFYRADPRPYLVLDIERGWIAAPVRFDDAGEQFPHVYGPLNLDAVVRVRRAVRGADGGFVGIEEGTDDRDGTLPRPSLTPSPLLHRGRRPETPEAVPKCKVTGE